MTASLLLKISLCVLAGASAPVLAQDDAPQTQDRIVAWTQVRVCPAAERGVRVAIVVSSGSTQADEAAVWLLESEGADLLENAEHLDAEGCTVGRVASDMRARPPAARVWDETRG